MGPKHRESSDRAIGNLIRWISRQGDWDDELASALDDHTALVCEALDTDRETLLEKLEPEIATNVFGCALEDLMSRRYEDPPTNVVDDYLKRRGWRESVPGKRYLQALRDAVISLYEVVDVKPGHHVDVRDLIQGGDPIRVIERAGSRDLVPWDQLAARVLSHLGSVTDGGQPTLGGVRIENGHVVMFTNSLERAERGKTMVAAGLGDLVGIGMTSVTSVEQMLSQHAGESGVEASEGDIPPDVQARVQQKVLDQHYRAWLDDSIPALDGQSPRDAAASDAGQPRLVSLLKQLENTEARRCRDSGQPPYDCTWMWEELGVSHLRK